MARAMSFPDKQTVLEFLKQNPDATTKQDIARGLKVKGRERQTLRAILKELEADGTLTKTGRREWAQSIVAIHHSLGQFGALLFRPGH